MKGDVKKREEKERKKEKGGQRAEKREKIKGKERRNVNKII